jgi:hypothetical protein
MAKQLPKGAGRAHSARRMDMASKTPRGVWVIVGMGLLFMIGGLGTGAFIAWKAIDEKTTIPFETVETGREETKRASGAADASSAEVGVERPKPIIAGGGLPPPVAADCVEQDQVRQEVLKRIDLMRGLSNGDKDKLYVQVERARGFTKIGIVHFTQYGTTPGAGQTEGLITNLNKPRLRNLLADPTVILITVGYADKQGEMAKNLEISRSRADVVKVLKENTDLANVMHAVGMGGQDLFDQSNLKSGPSKPRFAYVKNLRLTGSLWPAARERAIRFTREILARIRSM